MRALYIYAFLLGLIFNAALIFGPYVTVGESPLMASYITGDVFFVSLPYLGLNFVLLAVFLLWSRIKETLSIKDVAFASFTNVVGFYVPVVLLLWMFIKVFSNWNFF